MQHLIACELVFAPQRSGRQGSVAHSRRFRRQQPQSALTPKRRRSTGLQQTDAMCQYGPLWDCTV